MRLKVRNSKTEGLASRVVHISRKVDIVNLGAKVGLTCTKEETTSHPVDVRVLKEVGSGRPLSSPATEPDHLLATSEVVDNSSSGIGSEDAARTILRDLPGCSAVDDLCWVVEHVLSAHSGTSLNVGGRKASAVGDADQLLNIRSATSNTCVSRGSSEGRLGVCVDTNEANSERGLVRVDCVVLVNADTTVPDAAIIFEGKLTERDDSTVFTRRGGSVQGRKLESSLGDIGDLIGNTVALETRDDGVGIVALPDENEDCRINRCGHSCDSSS